MKDRTGQRPGNYRLTRLLGRGSFADVYLGQHIHLDTHQAAIKVLHTQLASEDMERFRAEANILAHNDKLVHRDLKPANLLLGRKNEVLPTASGERHAELSARESRIGAQQVQSWWQAS